MVGHREDRVGFGNSGVPESQCHEPQRLVRDENWLQPDVLVTQSDFHCLRGISKILVEQFSIPVFKSTENQYHDQAPAWFSKSGIGTQRLEHGTRRWGRILDEIGTLSTVPGQNRDGKVGMVHGRLAYMRQVADSSKVGVVHG
eukprot:COSAG02_NODE_108_length_36286_cov_19.437478_20_plen_143_part_00